MGFDIADDELDPLDDEGRDLSSLILDPQAPDYNPRRFLAACYRTVRAILFMKGHLVPGQALNEVSETLSSRSRIQDASSPFAGSDLPATPEALLLKTEAEDFSKLHGYLAMKVGFHPNDPCLEWFDHLEFFPTQEELLEFETQLLWMAGPVLQTRGRLAAFSYMKQVLDGVSGFERMDMLALPYAWVREMQAASTDDERVLQALRLEDLANRARDALDIRAELAARREQNSIQGLKFRDEERGNRELLSLLGAPRQKPRSLSE